MHDDWIHVGVGGLEADAVALFEIEESQGAAEGIEVLLALEPVDRVVVYGEPTPLEVIENPWVQWRCLLPRELDGEHFDEVDRVGRAAIEALGLKDGFTHMEWFLNSKGEAVFGEIACRAPGARSVDVMNYSANVDTFVGWANAATARRLGPHLAAALAEHGRR